jgi:hypothetical protein
VKERIKRGGYTRGSEERTIIPQNEKKQKRKNDGFQKRHGNYEERSEDQQALRQQQALKTKSRRQKGRVWV